MAGSKRERTAYPGVYYRVAERIGKPGEERVYYILFKKDGKLIEEKVGRQYADNMTPAKASGIRAERIEGKRQSRKELREAALEAKRAEEAKVTIGKLWNLYQDSLPDRKDWSTDRSHFRLYLAEFQNKKPDEITTLDIDALKKSLQKLGRSPQTVKHVLAFLRRLIRFGVKKGLCPQPDPSRQHFDMPTVDNQKTEQLTSGQLRNYLVALDEEPDQNAAALLRLALFTGMRKGALLALRWEDINFASGFITLRGSAAKKGKTERIPMSASVKTILDQIERNESPFVFPGRDGNQRAEFRRMAVRVKIKAGLPTDFRPLHGLRHAYASLLASSGQIDLYTLQKLLTHNSPQMTQRYAHLADEALQRGAGIIDFIIEEKTIDKT